MQKEIEAIRACMTKLHDNATNEDALDDMLEILKNSYGISADKHLFMFNREKIS